LQLNELNQGGYPKNEYRKKIKKAIVGIYIERPFRLFNLGKKFFVQFFVQGMVVLGNQFLVQGIVVPDI
jgi:hypothetical protein